MEHDCDILFIGGGLAGGLAAYRLNHARPGLTIGIVERGSTLGGAHTWSFHEGDLRQPLVSAASRWLEPLISASWPGYDVSFPKFTRRFDGRYHSIRSSDFHRVIAGAFREAGRLWLNSEAAELTRDTVRLTNGQVLTARLVIDSRGIVAEQHANAGFQKFVGAFVELEEPHGLDRPVLMDATVTQLDAFRFFYVLPFQPSLLLIEDTRYDSDPRLDLARFEHEILAYAERRGFRVKRIIEREAGCLPIPLNAAERPEARGAAPKIGMRGGLFHPATGYSMLEATRFAEWLTEEVAAADWSELPERIASYARSVWARGSFGRRLNNMLFLAAEPTRRFEVLQKFYELDPGLIRRFYAGELATLDQIKILSGRPPVPLVKGVRHFFSRSEVQR